MNSALQCLAHTRQLVDYFLKQGRGDAALWRRELNEANPIGSGGKVAREYAALLEGLWAADAPHALAPREFKTTLAQTAAQVGARTRVRARPGRGARWASAVRCVL
jgi:ubiquitin carboxyl-terminal hydrolase 4/11/15